MLFTSTVVSTKQIRLFHDKLEFWSTSQHVLSFRLTEATESMSQETVLFTERTVTSSQESGQLDLSLTESGAGAISDEMTALMSWILLTFICQGIVVAGMVANVINCICFVKQGFQDPVNISFLGLAISDFLCLFTLMWTNIFLNPAFRTSGLAMESLECQYLISGVPHTVFTRVTGWLTAFITLERCLCITVPMKVKALLTPKRVWMITIAIFVLLALTSIPEFLVNSLGWKYFPDRNQTLIGLVFTEDRERVAPISFLMNNGLTPLLSFSVVTVCTVVLVVKLGRKTKWRKKTTTGTQTEIVSNRSEKASKMVAMISILFVACFLVISVLFMAMALEPELFIHGKHKNLGIILGSFGVIFESVNSSVNIFFYYNMSTKYRQVFDNIFKLKG